MVNKYLFVFYRCHYKQQISFYDSIIDFCLVFSKHFKHMNQREQGFVLKLQHQKELQELKNKLTHKMHQLQVKQFRIGQLENGIKQLLTLLNSYAQLTCDEIKQQNVGNSFQYHVHLIKKLREVLDARQQQRVDLLLTSQEVKQEINKFKSVAEQKQRETSQLKQMVMSLEGELMINKKALQLEQNANKNLNMRIAGTENELVIKEHKLLEFQNMNIKQKWDDITLQKIMAIQTLERRENENQQLQQETKMLKNRLQIILHQLQTVNRSCNSLTQKLQSLQNQLSFCSRQREQLKLSVQSLQIQLCRKHSTIEERQIQIMSVRQKNEKLLSQNEYLSYASDKCKLKIQQLLSEVDNLRQNLELSNALPVSLKQKNEELQKITQLLQQKNEEISFLSHRECSAQKKITQLIYQIQNLQNNNYALQRSIKQHQELRKRQTNNEESLTNKRQSLEVTIQNQTQKIIRLKKEIAKRDITLHHKQQEMVGTKIELQNQKEQFEKIYKKIADSEIYIATLKQECIHIDQCLQQKDKVLKQTNASLQQKLEELQQVKHREALQKKRKKELITQVNKINSQNDELKQSIMDHQQIMKNQSCKIEELQKDIQMANKMIEDNGLISIIRHSQWNNFKASMEIIINNQMQRINQLKTQIIEKDQVIRKMQIQLTNATINLQKFKQNFQLISTKCADSQTIIANLNILNDDMESELQKSIKKNNFLKQNIRQKQKLLPTLQYQVKWQRQQRQKSRILIQNYENDKTIQADLLKSLKEDVEDKIRQMDDLNIYNRKLKEELQNAKTIMQGKQIKIAQLKSRISLIQGDYLISIHKIQSLSQQNKVLKKNIQLIEKAATIQKQHLFFELKNQTEQLNDLTLYKAMILQKLECQQCQQRKQKIQLLAKQFALAEQTILSYSCKCLSLQNQKDAISKYLLQLKSVVQEQYIRFAQMQETAKQQKIINNLNQQKNQLIIKQNKYLKDQSSKLQDKNNQLLLQIKILQKDSYILKQQYKQISQCFQQRNKQLQQMAISLEKKLEQLDQIKHREVMEKKRKKQLITQINKLNSQNDELKQSIIDHQQIMKNQSCKIEELQKSMQLSTTNMQNSGIRSIMIHSEWSNIRASLEAMIAHQAHNILQLNNQIEIVQQKKTQELACIHSQLQNSKQTLKQMVIKMEDSQVIIAALKISSTNANDELYRLATKNNTLQQTLAYAEKSMEVLQKQLSFQKAQRFKWVKLAEELDKQLLVKTDQINSLKDKDLCQTEAQLNFEYQIQKLQQQIAKLKVQTQELLSVQQIKEITVQGMRNQFKQLHQLTKIRLEQMNQVLSQPAKKVDETMKFQILGQQFQVIECEYERKKKQLKNKWDLYMQEVATIMKSLN